jgi:hypothetical protein
VIVYGYIIPNVMKDNEEEDDQMSWHASLRSSSFSIAFSVMNCTTSFLWFPIARESDNKFLSLSKLLEAYNSPTYTNIFNSSPIKFRII